MSLGGGHLVGWLGRRRPFGFHQPTRPAIQLINVADDADFIVRLELLPHLLRKGDALLSHRVALNAAHRVDRLGERRGPRHWAGLYLRVVGSLSYGFPGCTVVSRLLHRLLISEHTDARGNHSG